MKEIQQTKSVEFLQIPLFTIRDIMVITGVKGFEYADNSISTFHLFLFFFLWLDTTHTYYLSVSVGHFPAMA